MALGAFLHLAARSTGSDPGPTLSPALEGAYELGRGEARSGRSVDALLSAYRVGARVAWRELSEDRRRRRRASADDRPVRRVGVRVHRRTLRGKRFRACRRTGLLGSRDGGVISTGSASSSSLGRRPRCCRQVPNELTGDHRTPSPRCCFRRRRRAAGVPVRAVHTATQRGPARHRSLRIRRRFCSSRTCTGPTDPDCCENSGIAGRWSARPARGRWRSRRTTASCRPADLQLIRGDTDTIDTDTHLVELVLGADREAADDLRRQVLAPLDQLRPNTAERLAETLAIVAAASRSTRRGGGGPIRPRPNRALPDDPSSRAVR